MSLQTRAVAATRLFLAFAYWGKTIERVSVLRDRMSQEAGRRGAGGSDS